MFRFKRKNKSISRFQTLAHRESSVGRSLFVLVVLVGSHIIGTDAGVLQLRSSWLVPADPMPTSMKDVIESEVGDQRYVEINRGEFEWDHWCVVRALDGKLETSAYAPMYSIDGPRTRQFLMRAANQQAMREWIWDFDDVGSIKGTFRPEVSLGYKLRPVRDYWTDLPDDIWVFYPELKPPSFFYFATIGFLCLVVSTFAWTILMWRPPRDPRVYLMYPPAMIGTAAGIAFRSARQRHRIPIWVAIGTAVSSICIFRSLSFDDGIFLPDTAGFRIAAVVPVSSFGFAMILHALLTCFPGRTQGHEDWKIRRLAISVQPDDLREPVPDKSIVRTFMAGICKLLAMAALAGGLWVLCQSLNLGMSFIEVVVLFTTAIISLFSLIGYIRHEKTPYLEPRYTPMPPTHPKIKELRNRYQEAAGRLELWYVATLQAKYPTVVDVYLDASSTVVVEFIDNGQQALELTTMFEDGRVLISSSLGTVRFAANTHIGSTGVGQLCGTTDVELLFQHHCDAVQALADCDKTRSIVLSPTELHQVIHYAHRAYHELGYENGFAKRSIGPMEYGRFRFPDGVVG